MAAAAHAECLMADGYLNPSKAWTGSKAEGWHRDKTLGDRLATAARIIAESGNLSPSKKEKQGVLYSAALRA